MYTVLPVARALRTRALKFYSCLFVLLRLLVSLSHCSKYIRGEADES